MAFDKSLKASMVAEAPELVLGQGKISVQRTYFWKINSLKPIINKLELVNKFNPLGTLLRDISLFNFHNAILQIFDQIQRHFNFDPPLHREKCIYTESLQYRSRPISLDLFVLSYIHSLSTAGSLPVDAEGLFLISIVY